MEKKRHFDCLAECVTVLSMGKAWYHKGSLRKPCINSTDNDKSEDHPNHLSTPVGTEKLKKKKLGWWVGVREPRSNEPNYAPILLWIVKSLSRIRGKSIILRITHLSTDEEQKTVNHSCLCSSVCLSSQINNIWMILTSLKSHEKHNWGKWM